MWLARSRLDRGRLDECVAICDVLLADNPADQAAWFVKCKAVIAQNYIDDIEMEEESFAEVRMSMAVSMESMLCVSLFFSHGPILTPPLHPSTVCGVAPTSSRFKP